MQKRALQRKVINIEKFVSFFFLVKFVEQLIQQNQLYDFLLIAVNEDCLPGQELNSGFRNKTLLFSLGT